MFSSGFTTQEIVGVDRCGQVWTGVDRKLLVWTGADIPHLHGGGGIAPLWKHPHSSQLPHTPITYPKSLVSPHICPNPDRQDKDDPLGFVWRGTGLLKLVKCRCRVRAYGPWEDGLGQGLVFTLNPSQVLTLILRVESSPNLLNADWLAPLPISRYSISTPG